MISVRRAEESDKELFEEWLSKDVVHKSLGLSWEDAKDGSLWLVSDGRGPLMFVRLQEAMRVAMQFNPDEAYRTAKVAHEVIAWMKERARIDMPNLREIIIRPGGKAVKFAERLGFLDFVGKVLHVE